MEEQRAVPYYYEPRPYQMESWRRRLSGDIDYYFKIWHRQAGKDADDLFFALTKAYLSPGSQSIYVGLDNKWLHRNIWNKYIEGRRPWSSFPEDKIEPAETKQTVTFLNATPDKAEALIQFAGFKESESLIGSSYENFYISELSLYKRGAFDFIQPIWDSKEAQGLPFSINFNFTPRGLSNGAADLLRAYTGEDEPEKWPGQHGRVYVDVVRADQTLNANGGRLFTDDMLETIRQRYIRRQGNDNMFRQEYMCEFMSVNASLVYPAIEILRKEGRYCPLKINPDYPLYVSWDISSKDKTSDWTAAVVFQVYDGKYFILDWYEDNRKAVVDCVTELATRDYWYKVKSACLPWDSDRSGSRYSPLEECNREFPGVQWLKLQRGQVQDSINRVRKMMPNMYINSDTCDWLMECFESWEYKLITATDDYSAAPNHDRYSHLMDAVRYMADMLDQFGFVKENGGGLKMAEYYDNWDDDEEDPWSSIPIAYRPSTLSPLRKQKPNW